ncbi:MAG: hypothetical protein ACKVTZ_18890 [Bacteroidia bacterium]
MKSFNTSGPNLLDEHYTISRSNYLQQGVDLVLQRRYFTIWAPRQTGKSTYFRQLGTELTKMGYKICHINFENFKNASLTSFLRNLTEEITKFWGLTFKKDIELADVFKDIQNVQGEKYVRENSMKISNRFINLFPKLR